MGTSYRKGITPEEKAWLLENYFKLTREEITARLGRSWTYCTHIARRAGLMRRKPTPSEKVCEGCQLSVSGVCLYNVKDDRVKCNLFRYTSAKWQTLNKWDLI